ncbi:MAG TPA: cytochrome b/b6 domain-containing protein [Candidatus Competibacter sp.]|nr:cytochrome B [Candidatus Competibacteraceae bacterium]HRC71410.1 cytochrome b/b6 domain-containing protein [Candidatus Competibacter sp.]
MNTANTSEVVVWDPLVRLFHWVLVAAFCAAYLTEGEPFEAIQDQLDGAWLQSVHVWAGYTIAGLLLFRLVWGFVGPRHARFDDFVRDPRVTFAYVKQVLLLRAPRHLGHNPAGGAMIVILLLSLTVITASGLALYGADKGLGPLAGLLADAGDSTIHTLEEVHEFFANFTLLLVAGHLLGVIWESLLHRENLALAMFTGRKRA